MLELSTRTTQRYGWRPDLPDHRDLPYGVDEGAEQALPSKFLIDLLPRIFDQLQLGSCTANGIVRCLMAAGMKQGEAELMLSRLFVYWYERYIEGSVNEDSGAQIRDGIKVVAKYGAPPESEWPYDISNFARKPPVKPADAAAHEAIVYRRVDPRGPGSPLRSAIHAGLPVVFGFSVPEKFEDPSWNPATEALPLPTSNEGFIGGHCVVATGYDFTNSHKPKFRIDNSWGEGWGDRGRFWMDAHWLWRADLSDDFWVIEKVK